MRKTCVELVQRLCSRTCITRSITHMPRKKRTRMGTTFAFIRSFSVTYPSVFHRVNRVFTLVNFSYTHYPQSLYKLKLTYLNTI